MGIKSWGGTSDQAIEKLAASFPALRGRVKIEPWDVLTFIRSAAGASHGEMLAVRFVLGVWNPNANWNKIAREAKIRISLPPFDIFEAMNVWDQGSIDALIAWTRDPFFP